MSRACTWAVWSQVTSSPHLSDVRTPDTRAAPQGNRTPHTDPLSRGALIGLSLGHTRGHVFRCANLLQSHMLALCPLRSSCSRTCSRCTATADGYWVPPTNDCRTPCRALMEAVCFGSRLILETMAAAGFKPHAIHIAGVYLSLLLAVACCSCKAHSCIHGFTCSTGTAKAQITSCPDAAHNRRGHQE